MHTRQILLAAAVAASLALAGCANDAGDTAPPGTDSEDAASLDDADTGILDQVTAGETLALVGSVDQHEIDMAQQARDKGVQGELLAYADMLFEDHGANLEKGRALAAEAAIEPATTAVVGAQQAKGATVMERLAELEGEEYAVAWLDAMVQGHASTLEMLDERLETTARPELKTFLADTRDVVARHFEHGERLQGDASAEAADAR